MGDLSRNFSSREFYSQDTFQKLKSSGRNPAWYIDSRLVDILQDLRDKFGRIDINMPNRGLERRGFRSFGEAMDVNPRTAEWGFHRFGHAADISSPTVEPKVIQNYLRNRYNNIGLGLGETFTHIDTRNTRQLIEFSY